jgi:hypothetical protein
MSFSNRKTEKGCPRFGLARAKSIGLATNHRCYVRMLRKLYISYSGASFTLKHYTPASADSMRNIFCNLNRYHDKIMTGRGKGVKYFGNNPSVFHQFVINTSYKDHFKEALKSLSSYLEIKTPRRLP